MANKKGPAALFSSYIKYLGGEEKLKQTTDPFNQELLQMIKKVFQPERAAS